MSYRFSLLNLIFIVALFGGSDSRADTYYVAKNGNDDNPGNSLNRPLRSLAAATMRVQAGDTVFVMEGTYGGFWLQNKHGRADAWMVFMPFPGHQVVIDSYANNYATTWRAVQISGCSYVEIRGFQITDSNPLYDRPAYEDYKQGLSRDGIKWENGSDGTPCSYLRIIGNHIYHIGSMGMLGDGHHIEVIDNYVHHAGLSKQGYGLYIGGDDQLIRSNVVHDAYGFGMHLYSGHNSPDRMLVENNACFNNGRMDYGKGYPPFPGAGSDFNPATGKRTGDGILLFGGQGNMVRNNVCYGNMDWGVRVDARDCLLANNTLYGNGYQGIYVYENKNVIVRNNIAYQNRGEASYRGEYFIGAGNLQDHNLFGINPRFKDAAAGDFFLQPGSPAIDAGIAIEGFNTDKNNGVRPQGAAWDIGAFEFGTAPIREAAIMNMRLTEADRPEELISITAGVWYDLHLELQGWENIDYTDVWLHHSDQAEGTRENGGGRFFAASNYVISYSFSTKTIHAIESEGTRTWSDLTGKLGLYVDDDNHEYVLDPGRQRVKARVRLLAAATPGLWRMNAYIVDQKRQKSILFQKPFEVLPADRTPPDTPQGVKIKP